MRRRNFVICGLAGWCIEVFFTSAVSMFHKDKRLTGKSSAWMFPIYGLAYLIGDIYPKISRWPGIARAFLYGISIMSVEYTTGRLLTKMDVCPWCYDGCKYSIKGVIRLDFLPLWMMAGMFYEKLLKKV